MKKVFLLMTTVTLIGFSAKSQSLSFGLKAGATISNLKFSGGGISMTSSAKVGYYFGAIAELGLTDKFAIRPELFYSVMGGKDLESSGGEGDVGKDNLGYINLPVLLKYKSNGLSIFAGPQASLLASAKYKLGSATNDFKDQFKSADFSGVLGASYTLPNGIGIDARYQLGLSNIAKDIEGGSVKNNGFLAGIHYFFNR